MVGRVHQSGGRLVDGELRPGRCHGEPGRTRRTAEESVARRGHSPRRKDRRHDQFFDEVPRELVRQRASRSAHMSLACPDLPQRVAPGPARSCGVAARTCTSDSRVSPKYPHSHTRSSNCSRVTTSPRAMRACTAAGTPSWSAEPQHHRVHVLDGVTPTGQVPHHSACPVPRSTPRWSTRFSHCTTSPKPSTPTSAFTASLAVPFVSVVGRLGRFRGRDGGRAVVLLHSNGVLTRRWGWRRNDLDVREWRHGWLDGRG